MKILSEILFVISNGLMIPVLGLLLYLSARAVSLLFAFYKEYSRKKRIAGMFRHLIQNYSPMGWQCCRRKPENLEIPVLLIV